MKEIAALRLLFCFQISEILQMIRMIGNTNGINYGNTFGVVFECKIFEPLAGLCRSPYFHA